MASDAVKDILDQIANVNADADLLADLGPDGLDARLNRLATRLAEFTAFVEAEFDGRPPEQLVRYVKTSLGNPNRPTELSVGGVGQVIVTADEARVALDAWTNLAEGLRRYLHWWQLLDAKINPGQSEDRKLLADALTQLKSAANSMSEAARANDPAFSDCEAALTAAGQKLRSLGAAHDVRVPPDWEHSGPSATVPFEQVFERKRLVVEEHVDDRGGPIPLRSNLFDPDEPGPKWFMIGLEAFVLAVTAAAAAVIAARLLYIDKPFGSLGDYLTMFGAGIGSELIAAGVFAAVANWRAPIALPKLSP